MSDPQIINHLMAIRGDLSEVKANQASLRAWMDAHSTDDAKAHERIGALELANARRKGAASVWILIATGIGAAVGAVAPAAGEWFKAKVGS